ncbi:hypothetical protein D9757_014976 [Collybiopsis confluens]|uniref:Uncharacterized protein n=1 Tax=Collybiopsis confluens TaxID=2823264 RepID=A0A8H5CJJ7_9AGAR|nr:hypothetical protein D9757_014976 [Collybiopsis confluens]
MRPNMNGMNMGPMGTNINFAGGMNHPGMGMNMPRLPSNAPGGTPGANGVPGSPGAGGMRPPSIAMNPPTAGGGSGGNELVNAPTTPTHPPTPGTPQMGQVHPQPHQEGNMTPPERASRRDKEPDGAPTFLAGRIGVKEMGSRAFREGPKDLEKRKKKAEKDANKGEEKQTKRTADPGGAGFGYTDILTATQDVEGLLYRPRTAETRQVYELILSIVHNSLGGQARDIVRSAADMTLETFKKDGLKDFDKKKEIDEVLGGISSDEFTQLIGLSKKITDWGEEDEEMRDPDDVDGAKKEEEEEEEEDEGFEVHGSDESDNDDEQRPEGKDNDEEGVPAEDGPSDELVIGGESSKKGASSSSADSDLVSPHQVDVFWVQREISTVYPDPVTAQSLAASVLSILSSESSLRDCENQLMQSFEYQSFHITTKFLKNRDVVVWCTKLQRSSEEERINVEVAMREKGVGWILKELAGDRTTKRPSATQGNSESTAMDVDEPAEAVPVSGAPAPSRTLDLSTLAFSQGGHLMSNKNVKLPEDSFKRARKGFEEIHVPAPKSRNSTSTTNDNSEMVPIETLPLWARKSFSF